MFEVHTARLTGEDVSVSFHAETIRVGGSDELLVGSFIGTSSTLKSVRAWCASKTTKTRLKNSHMPTMVLIPSETGYTFHYHSVDPGWSHMVAIANDPGLLIGNTDDHWWKFLMSDQITTPMIRQWVPYIRGKLAPLCRECRGFGDDVFLAPHKTIEARVDEAVRIGLLNGDLKI